jgi:ethanolamine ammonia-lyase small subunit
MKRAQYMRMSHLGMRMVHDLEEQCVTIDMKFFIENYIKDFKEEEQAVKLKPVNTTAANHLFKTREGSVEKISKGRAGIFLFTVAKLLFCCKES